MVATRPDQIGIMLARRPAVFPLPLRERDLGLALAASLAGQLHAGRTRGDNTRTADRIRSDQTDTDQVRSDAGVRPTGSDQIRIGSDQIRPGNDFRSVPERNRNFRNRNSGRPTGSVFYCKTEQWSAPVLTQGATPTPS